MKSSFAKDEAELFERLSAYLGKKIDEQGLTYWELAERLKGFGFPDESKESLRAKLRRGKFSAAFLIAVAAALGIKRIDLTEI
jgi:hypothetical protein